MTVTDVAPKSSSKRAGSLLKYVLDMANLVPPGSDPLGNFPAPEEDPPKWPDSPQELADDLRACINQMPDPLRVHMLDYLVARMAVPDTRVLEPALEKYRGFHFGQEVVEHYYEIRRYRENLQKVARGELSVTITATLQPDKKNKVQIEPELDDVFLLAIKGTDYGYIRECAVCKRLFYAARFTQMGCTPETCGVTLRKRRERENKQLVLRGKAKRQKKRAEAARKR